MSGSSLVSIRECKQTDRIENAISQILTSLDWGSIIGKKSRVAIKLNLSNIDKKYIKASNTDPEIVRSVCRILKQRTDNLILVESDGIRYSAEEAFEKTGIYQIAEEVNAEVCNLSKEPQIYGLHPLLEDFGLPRLLIEETDVFITLPVLKTHALTTFTGALKNQWGCIPRHDRVLLHKNIHELIPIINKLLNPQICIMDGICGMEGRGPTSGKPRNLGLILGSRNPASLDATAMRLVGLNPDMAKHIVLSNGEELGPINENDIEIDGDFEKLKTNFEPANLDWAIRSMNDLTKYPFFVKHILENPAIFEVGKAAVKSLRAIGVVR